VRLKHGVSLKSLSPQMVVGLMVVASVFERFRVECVVTSANDSRHSDKSLHYVGCALDFRTKFAELNGREHELAAAVKADLGPDFDVVIEAVGTDNEHLHVEYDPKG
jgi:threonine dehydrogenase-like Zn-dependent dehydrogenase